MPSALKKSSSGSSFSREILKCVAARFKISSSVLSVVGILILFEITSTLRQVRLSICTLYEFLQTGFDGGPGKQFAEDFDFPPQLLLRNPFDKPFGNCGCLSGESLHPRTCSPRPANRF